MDTAVRQKPRPEVILAILALVAAAALCVMVALCLPYFSEDPEVELKHHHTTPTTEAATEPPATEGPTEPTLPLPESNPYGRNDFQYNGRYLSCLRCDSVPGIDVSAYQGEIDWEQVADSGIKFAIVRVGYRGYGGGQLVEDKHARKNLKGAIDAGLDVGVYFFSQAISPEEAAEEAAFVMDIIKDYEITLPVVYDWEYINDTARTADMDARTLTDCCIAFCQAVETAGYSPMVYFNSYQARTLMYLHELEDYPFWLALYSDRMTYPYRIEMWQYTNTGKVPGIEGDVDINVMFLDQ